MVSAMGYQQHMENNVLGLVRFERVEKGHLTVSSLGTPSVMTGYTMESLISWKGGGGEWLLFIFLFLPDSLTF